MVAQLTGVAIVITVVSIMGISWINDSTEQLGRLANRSVNMVTMDRITQERAAASLRIIVNTDPVAVDNVVKNYFDPTESAMEEELADYAANFPDNPTEDMVRRPMENDGFPLLNYHKTRPFLPPPCSIWLRMAASRCLPVFLPSQCLRYLRHGLI